MTKESRTYFKKRTKADFQAISHQHLNFEILFLMVFAIKMILDNTYGLLNLLELFFNCFDSLYKAEYEFQNSNFGGKGY